MSHFLRASLALALLACSVACKSSAETSAKEAQIELHREFALRYFDQKDLARAEQQADKGLELAPEDDRLLLLKGWIRQQRGTTQDIFVAEAIFRELVEDGDYRALLGLGQALERKGVLYEEAAVAVASGARETTAPDPAARATDLGEQAKGFWREATVWYERTLEKKPGEFQAINGMQRVTALLGEHEKSLEWARTLLDLSTAEISFWQAQLERADISAPEEKRLRTMLASSRNLQRETHMQASNLLVRLDRKDEALQHIDGALAIDPDDAQANSRRGWLCYELSRYEDALASLRAYLRLSTQPVEHPDITRAFDMIKQCETQIARAAIEKP